MRSTGTYLEEGEGLVHEKTVVVHPGSGKAVDLGIYSAALPGPEYDVTYSPDIQEDIGLSQERLEIPGQPRYMLLFQFHNFSQKTCRITLHLRSTAAGH